MIDKLTEILGEADDEALDELLAELLAWHWKGETGHDKTLRWLALGRAAEDARNYLHGGAGRMGMGAKFAAFDTDVKRERMRSVIDMFYEIVRQNAPDVPL